jgi:hypothetical protein
LKDAKGNTDEKALCLSAGCVIPRKVRSFSRVTLGGAISTTTPKKVQPECLDQLEICLMDVYVFFQSGATMEFPRPAHGHQNKNPFSLYGAHHIPCASSSSYPAFSECPGFCRASSLKIRAKDPTINPDLRWGKKRKKSFKALMQLMLPPSTHRDAPPKKLQKGQRADKFHICEKRAVPLLTTTVHKTMTREPLAMTSYFAPF